MTFETNIVQLTGGDDIKSMVEIGAEREVLINV